MIELSAVICTYNRDFILGHAIESLCQQTLPPERYEIIIVDNASTDNTIQVVAAKQQAHPQVNLRYVAEPQPGLAFARNRGLQEAQATIIAFYDDDALMPDDAFETVLHLYSQLGDDVVSIGGPMRPWYHDQKPAWFLDEYASWDRGSEPMYLAGDDFLLGGNVAWKRATLLDVGGFNTKIIGMKAGKIGLGEDVQIFDQVRKTNPNARFYYHPSLYIEHYVPPFKMKATYYLKRSFVAGRFHSARVQLSRGASLTTRLRINIVGVQFLRMLRKMFVSPGKLSRYPHWQNWLIDTWQPIAHDWGFITHLLGIPVSVKQS